MKNLFFCLLLISSIALHADDIHLKNGKIIKGKILRVTAGTIEYNPEGDIPFNVLKRENVNKIIYDNGAVVNLSGRDETALSEKSLPEDNDGLDSIYLKDGNIVRGKILNVMPKYIEYDPAGVKKFGLFPRGQVVKIKYADNRVVMLSDGGNISSGGKKINNTAYGDKANRDAGSIRGFIEIEAGWNGYAGLGPRMDYKLTDLISGNIGFGLGMWGYRFSAGFRLNMNYPYGAAFGLGVAYNTGSLGQEDPLEDMETVDSGGLVQKEDVYLETRPVTTINASFLYSWDMGGDRLYMELGYSYPLKKEQYNYRTESNSELTDESKEIIDFLHPGGIIISIGYAFNF